MSLPSQFTHSEHIQSVTRKVYNDDVKDWFSDLGGEDWDRDIGTSRGSMRVACTHDDNDSLLLTMIRMQLFDNMVRKPNSQFPSNDVDEKQQVSRKTKPKIVLHFWQDAADIDPEYDPVRGRISFRLMDKTASTLTQADLTNYAQRIKSNFGVGSGYVWPKGKIMYSYTDWESGYQLQLLCRNISTAKEIISKTLEIKNDVPNWANLNTIENSEPNEAYPTIPGTEVILGKVEKQPRYRPIATVRFQYATLSLGRKRDDITLIDKTGLLKNPIAS